MFTYAYQYIIRCDMCKNSAPIIPHDYDRFSNGNAHDAEEAKKLYTRETIQKITKSALKSGFIRFKRNNYEDNLPNQSMTGEHGGRYMYLCIACANYMHKNFAQKSNTKTSSL